MLIFLAWILLNIFNQCQSVGITAYGEVFSCLNKEDFPRYYTSMQGIIGETVYEFIWCKGRKISHKGMEQLYLQRGCGKPNGLFYNIYGGTEVPLISRPWMAFIYTPNGPCRCGGTLITERYVLTAAHCYEMCPGNNNLRVRLGEHNILTTEDCYLGARKKVCFTAEDYEIESVFVHEDFSFSEQINDIALVRLKQVVQYKEHILPICLPLNNVLARISPITKVPYLAAGWGLKDIYTTSDTLREVTLLSKKCPNLYGDPIENAKGCTNGNEKDTCRGDSGGPLIRESDYYGRKVYVQYGIVSHGSSSSCGSETAYYTQVAYYIPWIIEKLEKFPSS